MTHFIPIPNYFFLRCGRCRETFLAVVATSEHEILCPDFVEMAEDLGPRIVDQFETFFREHAGHGLQAVSACESNGT